MDAYTEQDFIEIEVKLDSLRADTSYNFRQRHYTETVTTLIKALDKASIEVEAGDGRANADNLGLGMFRNQF